MSHENKQQKIVIKIGKGHVSYMLLHWLIIVYVGIGSCEGALLDLGRVVRYTQWHGLLQGK
jgi:hypothetical protein